MAFDNPARWALIGQRFSTPLPIYNCPSRRSGGPFENTGWGTPFPYRETGFGVSGNGLIIRQMARADYVACSGDQRPVEIDGGPPIGPAANRYAVADGVSGTYNWFPGVHANSDFTRADGQYGPSGLIYRRSESRMADCAQKGTSNQYMIGEKFLRPDKYQPGGSNLSDGGDNENMFTGHNNDVGRVTFFQPAQDQLPPFRFPDAGPPLNLGNNETSRFGSAHPSGFNMMMADGSVHHIKYSIDRVVFRQGGNRQSTFVGSFTN
jgi:prepilin-type processing-associated H-X9-DG protein